ncbi:hypothetical protein [Leuconostoc mesenteroides]|uniref:hypothetical protein n=1 Tax=Leuconostoc mesenteroides TaxID=1245 RepID=UPI00235FBF2F|nr:hypothetical protein [Leuconostoc mesenteroides]
MFDIPIVDELNSLIKEAVKYAERTGIKKIVIFSQNGDSGLKLKKYVDEINSEAKVITIMFPANEPVFVENEEGNVDEIIPNDTSTEINKKMRASGIEVIFGTLPLDNVVVPGTPNAINLTIKNTLSMFTPGLQLAVQAILIATDHDSLSFGDPVISIVGDVAISARAANSRMLFHSKYGLKIEDIIAKKQQIQ